MIAKALVAINKPAGISSAQVVREVKNAFTKSAYFRPWLEEEQQRRMKEGIRQNKRRNSTHRKVEIKVGHGGTLDPGATGCLVIGIGNGTKQLTTFIESRKSYDTVVLFGAATDSYDKEGKVLAKAPFDHLTKAKVEKALEQFRGDIKQQPPIFSALKMDGSKLYEYARSGKEPPREIIARPAKVYHLEMMEWLEPGTHGHTWPTTQASDEEIAAGHKLLQLPKSAKDEPQLDEEMGIKRKRSMSPELVKSNKEQKLTANSSDTNTAKQINTTLEKPEDPPEQPPATRLTMHVGSGFYVRSLCHDLGKAVDSLALMASLVRTNQGPFTLGENVLAYEDLTAGEKVWQPKIQAALEKWSQRLASARSSDGDTKNAPEIQKATETA